MPTKKRAGRPRNEKSRQSILQAAHEILSTSGFGQVTVEAVAARAGVGKPTIYRYWSNALELAMAAVMATDADKPSQPQTDATGVQALRVQLQGAVDRFSSPIGRQVTWLMAAAEQETELFKAFRNQVIMRYRSDGHALLEQAIESGEIRADTPIETTLDLLYGPIFYRLLTGHAALSRQFADDLLATVLQGITVR